MTRYYNFATFQPDWHTPRKTTGQEPAASKSGMRPPARVLKGANGPLDFQHAVKTCTPRSGAPQKYGALVTRLSQAKQGERQRISQILHDDLQQLLCSIHIKLCLQYESGESDQKALTDCIRSDITKAITMTRELSSELATPHEDKNSLLAMLEWLASHMHNQFGLAVTIACPRDFRIGSEEMRILLYQAVRELLFNVVKHAGTRSVTVTLKIKSDRFCIQVADSGNSMDVKKFKALLARPKAQGLAMIREQLILHGGHLQITTVKGKGTRVLVSIPKKPEGTIAA